jgi:Astacin (Peptidase family M12A)
MKQKIKTFILALGLVIALVINVPYSAEAGILVGTVHNPTIKVCFVGNAVTTQQDDIKFITTHLRLYENYGHIKYELMGSDGKCPAPTQTADGNFDVNEGDLRIGVPDTLDVDGTTPITGLALGKGCADPGTTGWWANFPGNLNDPKFRACRMNAYLRNDMALNKILHEIGHSLGLSHEHERTDVPKDSDPMVKVCFDDVSYFGKSATQGVNGITLVTPYDRDSVLHYEINHRIDPTNVPASSTCNLGNDNGTTGLSYYDQLTIRILYPHDSRVAEYLGATVVQVGQPVTLINQWGASGALIQNIVKNPVWSVKQNSAQIVNQNSPNLSYTFDKVGDYTIQYTFQDMLNRPYSNSFMVKVLSPEKFRQVISGANSASSVLL